MKDGTGGPRRFWTAEIELFGGIEGTIDLDCCNFSRSKVPFAVLQVDHHSLISAIPCGVLCDVYVCPLAFLRIAGLDGAVSGSGLSQDDSA